MADQAKKVQIQTTSGVKIFPRTSVDNIVIAVGSTVSALATTISGGTAASDQKIPTEKAVSTALAGKASSSHAHTIANVYGLQTALDGKLSSVPDATASAKGAVKVTTTASYGVALSISSGTLSVSTTQASGSAFGTVKVGSNISVSSGVISVADASSSTKGVVKLCSDISSTTSSDHGGAADAYAVKLYIADQLDIVSCNCVNIANLVSDLSGVTGPNSGGGDNPPTSLAVKQALAPFLTFEEITES